MRGTSEQITQKTDQQLFHESREQLLLKILLRLGLKLVTQSPPPLLLVTIALLGVHLVRAVLGKRLLAASSLGRKCLPDLFSKVWMLLDLGRDDLPLRVIQINSPT